MSQPSCAFWSLLSCRTSVCSSDSKRERSRLSLLFIDRPSIYLALIILALSLLSSSLRVTPSRSFCAKKNAYWFQQILFSNYHDFCFLFCYNINSAKMIKKKTLPNIYQIFCQSLGGGTGNPKQKRMWRRLLVITLKRFYCNTGHLIIQPNAYLWTFETFQHCKGECSHSISLQLKMIVGLLQILLSNLSIIVSIH